MRRAARRRCARAAARARCALVDAGPGCADALGALCSVGDEVRRSDVVLLVSESTGMFLRAIVPRDFDADAEVPEPVEVAVSSKSCSWFLKPYHIHTGVSSTLRCGEFFRLHHWEREAFLVAGDAPGQDDPDAPGALDESDTNIVTVFLQPSAASEDAGGYAAANGLWELEHADPTIGEEAVWGKVYRIRHLCTGKYLAMSDLLSGDNADAEGTLPKATTRSITRPAASRAGPDAAHGGGVDLLLIAPNRRSSKLGLPRTNSDLLTAVKLLSSGNYPYHVYLSESSRAHETQFVLQSTEPNVHGAVARNATMSIQHCATKAYLIGPKVDIIRDGGASRRSSVGEDSIVADAEVALGHVAQRSSVDPCGLPWLPGANDQVDGVRMCKSFDFDTCSILTGSTVRTDDDALRIRPCMAQDTSETLTLLYALPVFREYIRQFSRASSAHVTSPHVTSPGSMPQTFMTSPAGSSRDLRAGMPRPVSKRHARVTKKNARQLWRRGVSAETTYACADAIAEVKSLLEFVCNTRLSDGLTELGAGLEPVPRRQNLLRELEILDTAVQCLTAPFSPWGGPIDVGSLIGKEIIQLCGMLYALIEYSFKVCRAIYSCCGFDLGTTSIFFICICICILTCFSRVVRVSRWRSRVPCAIAGTAQKSGIRREFPSHVRETHWAAHGSRARDDVTPERQRGPD